MFIRQLLFKLRWRLVLLGSDVCKNQCFTPGKTDKKSFFTHTNCGGECKMGSNKHKNNKTQDNKKQQNQNQNANRDRAEANRNREEIAQEIDFIGKQIQNREDR